MSLEEVPLIGLGDWELERLVLGKRREAGSWFQRRVYWNCLLPALRMCTVLTPSVVTSRPLFPAGSSNPLNVFFLRLRFCYCRVPTIVRVYKLVITPRKRRETNVVATDYWCTTLSYLRANSRVKILSDCDIIELKVNWLSSVALLWKDLYTR